MKKVKIAQIGISMDSHGGQIFKSICRQNDLFEAVGYCLPENERVVCTPERLKCFEGYSELSLDEILNDPTITAVTVETEEKFLTKYALLAAQHGKNIHMEKPGGIDLPEFEKLVKTVRKNGTVLHIGYMYRYNPYVNELMQHAASGAMGHINFVETAMSCYQPDSRYEYLGTLPGGMMFFLGCHLIDLVMQFLGEPDEIVDFTTPSGRGGKEIDDLGMIVFKYKNALATIKTSGTERGGYLRRKLVVVGEKETVELCPLEMGPEAEIQTDRTVYATTRWQLDGEHSRAKPFDRYDTMIAAFAAMACGEKENPFTLDYELKLYKTVLKCCKLL